MSKGHFIVFEGGEGSGKTRQTILLSEKLKKNGQAVLTTHEPGNTKVGRMIRQIILYQNNEPVHDRTELFLFLADRAQHVEEVIKPALARGQIVICDRFSGSTLAYQLGGRGLPETRLVRDMDFYARHGLKPDLVFYLDIDPLVGLQRKNAKQDEEPLNRIDKEGLAFHERVHSYFQQLADNDRNWHVISTIPPKEEVAQKIYEIVLSKIS